MLNSSLDYDVLVIGAGLSGILTLYRMQELGLRVLALEAGSSEGGTWFWNRYPGVRFDSESVSYGFQFSKEVLDEWDWTETFAPGHETLKYAQYLTEKFRLRQYMQFDTEVKSAHFQNDGNSWILQDTQGKSYTSRFLITAVGILSKATLPDISGIETFKNEAFHASRWPEVCDLKDKRVGVIGTGATGIQIIQTIVKPEYGLQSLTVFQRTPNWSAPLRNQIISSSEMNRIRELYPRIFEQCSKSWSGFIHNSDKRKTLEVREDERLKFWEELYAQPGFAKWLANFGDINTDAKANAAFSAFIADKIRGRVNDPETAEKLIPKNHGFGTRRVPLETNYFEAYNDPRVRLIDIGNQFPIERVTETGVQLQSGEHVDLDVLIYATGFDAITGPLSSIDIRGISGTRLGETWLDGPRTFLGLFAHDFPNMFMIMGPHQMFGNITRSIEYAVTWVATFIKFCNDRGITYAEARKGHVKEWTQHVHDCAQGLLANEVDSWMSGVNKNLPGKQKRIIARYQGSAPGYRQRCDDVAAREYADLKLH